jgi:glycosyltransferase involved in cell wall biosynthesis
MATKNRARSMEDVLESYTRLTEPPGGWEVILVDNGSTDSTAEVARRFAARLPLKYVLEPQAGQFRAINSGLDRAKGDLFLFTDDDILPAEDWLTQYAEAAASRPDFDLFGGPVKPKWPFNPPSWAISYRRARTVCFMDTGHPQATGPTETWLSSQNLAIRRGALTPNRRFDPEWSVSPGGYIMGGDAELVGRLRREGSKAWWIAEAMVEHIVRPEQLSSKWMLRRAAEFGRGRYWLDEEYGRRVPMLAGMPRWLVRHAIEQSGRVAAAWIRRDKEGLFVARWDLNVHLGALGEARRTRGARYSGRAAR